MILPLIDKIISGKYDEDELQKQVDKKYFIFIYKIGAGNNLTPVFWNTQVIAPNSFVLHSDNGIGFRKLLNGWYVTNKKTFQSPSGAFYKVIFLIPVKWDYYIQNQYLHNTFVAENNIEKAYDISLTPTRYTIKDLQGKPLFYLRKLNNPVGHDNTLALILRILASIFILFFIHRLANYYVQKKGFWIGLAFLLVPLILLRVLSYLLPIPLNFNNLELFDPAIYGANFILRSLGDLLINSILFIWIVLFVRYHFKFDFSKIKFKSDFYRYAAIVFICALMVLFTLLGSFTVQSLVADSQISFDVINFFTLNIYSVIGFIVLSCVATGYFFLITLLLQPLNIFVGRKRYQLYLILSIVGLFILTFNLHSVHLSFNLAALLWLLVFIFLLNFRHSFTSGL